MNRINLRVSITNRDEGIPSPVMNRMSQMQLNSPTATSNGNYDGSLVPEIIFDSSALSPHKPGNNLSLSAPSFPTINQSSSPLIRNESAKPNQEESPSPTSNVSSLSGRRRLTQSLTLKRRLFENPTNALSTEEVKEAENTTDTTIMESPRNSKRLSTNFKNESQSDFNSDDSNIDPPHSDDEAEKEDSQGSYPRRTLNHSVSSPTMGDLRTNLFNPIPFQARLLANNSSGSNSSPLSRKKRADSIRNCRTSFRNNINEGLSLHKSTDNICAAPSQTPDNTMRRTFSTMQASSLTDNSNSLLPSIKKDGCFYVTPEIVSELLNDGAPKNPFLIVDCRFSYEYNGGHVKDAINIGTVDELEDRFLKQTLSDSKRTIIIFHCEFSSKRGPSLCSHLRKRDREIHYSTYPELHYPEIYVMEGGYKRFFTEQKDLCEPPFYITMDDPSFKKECKDGMDQIHSFRMKKSLSMNNLSVAKEWKREVRTPLNDIFNSQSNPTTPTYLSGQTFNLSIPSNLNSDISLMRKDNSE